MKTSFKTPTFFSILLFLSILILSVIISFQLKHKKQQLQESYSANQELSTLLSISSEKDKILLMLNYQKLNDISIQSLNGEFVSLTNEIKFPILIFRFDPNRACAPCIDNTLRLLNLVGDKIGNDKILLLSKFNSINELKLLRMKNPINFRSYNYKGDWIETIENSRLSQTQVTFIFEKNQRVLFPYLPSTSDSISNNYYSKIIDFFKESESLSNTK
jgi:hypothetical protein